MPGSVAAQNNCNPQVCNLSFVPMTSSSFNGFHCLLCKSPRIEPRLQVKHSTRRSDTHRNLRKQNSIAVDSSITTVEAIRGPFQLP